MNIFFTILGILILLFLINFVFFKFFRLSGIVRFLIITGILLLILGVYSIPYLDINWTTVLIVLGIILIATFILYLLSRFITPGVVKSLIVLSVVLLLFSIFLVTLNTIKTDKENKDIVTKDINTNAVFNPNEQLGFNTKVSMKELDSLSANVNKNYNLVYNKDITPNDLEEINRRNKIRI